MKKYKPILLFFFIFLFAYSVTGASTFVTDNFNGNLSDLIFDNFTTGGGKIEFVGDDYLNLTTDNVSGEAWVMTKFDFENSTDGYLSLNYKTDGTMNNGNYYCRITVGQGATGNQFLSAPPTSCGIAIDLGHTTDNVTVVRDYPTSAIVGHIDQNDVNWHELEIYIVRGIASDTLYLTWIDGVQTDVTLIQDTACANPSLNVTLQAYTSAGSGTIKESCLFDDFYMEYNMANVLGNGTGAGCEADADCDCGNCEYGFCALINANQPCTDNECCLSGLCSNNKCTNPGIWVNIDTSTNQLLGDDPFAKNFIALFFIVGIPIVLTVLSKSMLVGLASLMLSFMLMFFFTMVGWLSPFILIGGIVAVLLLIVMAFMLRGGSD